MQTNPESAAVDAVAWRYRLNEKGNGPWGPGPWWYETHKPTLSPSRFYDLEPLVPQSALDALRGEVERARIAGIDACDKLTMLWQKDIDRADTAERRVAELEAGLASARRAIGDHHAPNDCYATGPLTGDEFLDLVQCPACAFIDQYAALTKESP